MATTEKNNQSLPIGCVFPYFLCASGWKDLILCELSEHAPIVPTFRQECRDGKLISLPNYLNKEARPF